MVAIRKGEFITCESGHLICEVLADIIMGELGWTSKLGNFRVTEPKCGEPIPSCPCGAQWIAPVNRLHVEGRGFVPPCR
jgi:hypothetical protein